MNKKAAEEWLTIAYHDLQSARILYEANHYTDSIGNDLQQALEKILKSLIAYKNEKIPKTHDLYEIYISIEELKLDEKQIVALETATEYFKEDRYPNPNYSLPSREEIKDVLDTSNGLFIQVCDRLGIDAKEIQ